MTAKSKAAGPRMPQAGSQPRGQASRSRPGGDHSPEAVVPLHSVPPTRTGAGVVPEAVGSPVAQWAEAGAACGAEPERRGPPSAAPVPRTGRRTATHQHRVAAKAAGGPALLRRKRRRTAGPAGLCPGRPRGPAVWAGGPLQQ